MTNLTATLPARWGNRQRLKNTLIYYGLRIAHAAVRAVPYGLMRFMAMGPLLGWVGFWVARKERQRSLDNIAAAFPEMTSRQVRAVARGSFVHLARSCIEMTHLHRFVGEQDLLRPQHHELFTTALAEGKGVIAITGHIGNWELVAQVVARRFPTTTIASPLYDPRLTQWVQRVRAASGLGVVWRGAAGVSRQMLRVLKNGEILAFLIDQDTKVQGEFVEFFGRDALTPTAPAILALRTGVPIIVGWDHRLPNGKHELHFERIESSDDDIRQLTARLTARLESAIRTAPEQWVWMHDRWKTAC